MTEVPGLETIRGLVGEPPRVVQIPYDLIRTEEIARQGWNSIYIAIIPYCYKCKEPLVWHSPPREDTVLFHCPKCQRKWIEGKDWKKKK